MTEAFFSHATALIDDGAQIGDDTKVWHWSHVCQGAVIGRKCVLGQNVYVAGSVVIGNNVKIQNNVSIYDGVEISDDVFCGPSMVFTNVINPRAFIERKDEFRRTLIHRGATLGANCTVVCGVEIGEYALVAAGAVVTQDVAEFAIVMGVPARQTGWVSRAGETLDLPLTGNAQATCKIDGEVYRLQGNAVTRGS